MSTEQLQEIADRAIAQARSGEQVEAFVSRDSETDIRVYEGSVEHFVSAQSEGIGIRVIRDGRTGFAYAGTLDPAAIAEVLADARDNVEFGTCDEWAGLAEPDGVEVVEQQLWNEALADFATDRKIELAKELERLTVNVDPRVRVDDSNYSDVAVESAVATTTGIRRSGRENGCYVSISTLADDGDETQTGFGFSVGRSPDQFDLAKAAKEAADRATRLLGAVKPSSKRVTVVLDPYVTAMFLGVISSTLNGEAVAKGRSLFKDRLGDVVANPMVTLVDDPTNTLAYTATDLDGEGLAARRNVLIDAGVLQQFVHNSYSARRAGAQHGQRRERGLQGHPRRRVPGPAAATGHPRSVGLGGRCRRRCARHLRAGSAQRRQLHQRRLLGGRVGPAHHERRRRCTHSRVHHRVHSAAHAARRGGDRWRCRLAADAGRRGQPGDPRHHALRCVTRCVSSPAACG